MTIDEYVQAMVHRRNSSPDEIVLEFYTQCITMYTVIDSDVFLDAEILWLLKYHMML